MRDGVRRAASWQLYERNSETELLDYSVHADSRIRKTLSQPHEVVPCVVGRGITADQHYHQFTAWWPGVGRDGLNLISLARELLEQRVGAGLRAESGDLNDEM